MKGPKRIPVEVFQQLLAAAIAHKAGVHHERARSFASFFVSIDEFIAIPFHKRRFLTASGKQHSILTAAETKRAEMFRQRIAGLKNPIEETSHVVTSTKAMSKSEENGGELSLEDRVNAKLKELSLAFAELQFPRASLPEWVRKDFADHELFWLAAAMTAFFDKGV